MEAQFPEKLQILFQPQRYKVLYGGRGGAKSWGIARALLLQGTQRPMRVLCARELQNSIADSVHKLLSDQIKLLELEGVYDIQKAYIRGSNGTEFSFEGIRHNVNKIKSYEGVDICWVEEAHMVSASSWETLIPTIRKEGSEIWVSFNPSLETDETYQRFVVHPPTGCKPVFINWRDNPWFSDVLRQEMEDLKNRNYDRYLNVWEGHCLQLLDGAVYAKELRDAQAQGRICKVPWEHSIPVDTFWDLGRRDSTAIWFAQKVGFEYRIVDYFEDRGYALEHYLRTLQERPYVYGTIWLPHDATAQTLGSKRSIEEQVKATGKTVKIVPRLKISDGLNAARTIFPNCWFDEQKCRDGLQCLRHYRYDVVEGTQTYSKEPLHDWTSHAADAFRYLAISLRDYQLKKSLMGGLKRKLGEFPHSTGWLS